MTTEKGLLTPLFWASSGGVLAKAMDALSLVVLARILGPEIFGLMAAALLAVHLIGLLTDLGFQSALIQRRDRVEAAAFTALVVTLPLSLALAGLAFGLAGPMASLFDDPRLRPVIMVLSLVLILQAVAVVPSALLQKNMEYKKRMLPDVGAAVAYFLTALTLALSGWGVWSLVGGYLLRTAVSGVLLWRAWGRAIRGRPERALARELWVYGRHILLLGVLSFSIKNLDNFAVAKFLTTQDLGFYAIAFTVGNFLPTIVKMSLARVVFPFYAKLRENREEFQSRFLMINQINLAFAVFATILLIAAAPTLIPLIWGEGWRPVVPLVQVLSLYGFQRAVSAVSIPALNALGVPQANREPVLSQALLMILLLYPAAAFFGVQGVAWVAMISVMPGFVGHVQTFEDHGSPAPSVDVSLAHLSGGWVPGPSAGSQGFPLGHLVLATARGNGFSPGLLFRDLVPVQAGALL